MNSEQGENLFFSWLITHTNALGRLYKPKVAIRYTAALRNFPPKLDLSFLSTQERNIYLYDTREDFDWLDNAFRTASNFHELDRKNHGLFSAALSAYRRFIVDFEESSEDEFNETQRPVTIISSKPGQSDDSSKSAEEELDTLQRKDRFNESENPGTGISSILEQSDDSSKFGVDKLDTLLHTLEDIYPTGFRFEATSLNLLSGASGVEIDWSLKAKLKNLMFGRRDGVFFLQTQVCNEKTRDKLVTTTDSYLREFGCFELSEVYHQFEEELNPKSIKSVCDFEDYYVWLAGDKVRCVTAPRVINRIVRYSAGNATEPLEKAASKIVASINEQHYGSCTEEELHEEFSAFSIGLLNKLLRYYAENELVRVEINDSFYYQSFAALGLPENFSETLCDTISALETVDLPLTQEALHTVLSVIMGQNLKSEFSLPDWGTFRRLIALYYTGETPRQWKNNVFIEVDN